MRWRMIRTACAARTLPAVMYALVRQIRSISGNHQQSVVADVDPERRAWFFMGGSGRPQESGRFTDDGTGTNDPVGRRNSNEECSARLHDYCGLSDCHRL